MVIAVYVFFALYFNEKIRKLRCDSVPHAMCSPRLPEEVRDRLYVTISRSA